MEKPLEPDHPYPHRRHLAETFRWHSNALLLAVALVATMVLVFGWYAGVDFFRRLAPDYPAMVPATAMAALLGALGSLTLRPDQGRALPVSCGVLILVVTALEWLTPLGHWSHGDNDDMSVASMTAALLIAAALIAHKKRARPHYTLESAIDTLGLGLATIALIGYLFDARALWGNFVFTTIALHTSVCFFVLFLARLLSDADRNWMGTIYAEERGSQMVRRVLPVVVIGPVVLCYLALYATRSEVLTEDFRLTILAFSIVVIGTAAVIASAEQINRADRSAREFAEELRRRDLDFVRAQKIAVLGQLVGGVAHDFNNILAVVIGNLELLEEEETDRDRMFYIEQAVKAANNAAALTGQLLAYGRKSRLDPVPVRIDTAVEEAVAMFRRVSGTGITVETDLDAEGQLANLDTANLQQALLNVLINARDASPTGSAIRIATRIETTEPPPDAVNPDDYALPPGRYLLIEVRDSGAGMDADTLERATEPYFTTKGVGEGSGLGLSMVQGFCRQSQGDLRIESRPGAGTTVTMYFAALDRESLPAPAQDPAPAPSEGASRGRILIVDDEEGVLRVMSRQLEREGYAVSTAQNANDAMAALDAGEVPDLVITDVIMPGVLQGHQLAVLIHQLYPQVKVLLMSGYQSNSLRDQYSVAGRIEFLQKPISRTTLREAVARVLSETGNEPET